ncbi:MAG: polyphosphate kinase 1 [bacterium]|nr:polyphosphate kinase 1 [bacterium]
MFFNRDLSWVSFNYRVLQEAKNPEVPLIERLKFLAIYSSNLDEFYRVRVASHRHLMRLKENTGEKFALPQDILVKKINKKVNKQQSELGEIFRNQVKPGLAEHNIFIVDESNLDGAQREFAREYYRNEVSQFVTPVYIDENADPPFLENRRLYFAARVAYSETGKSKETIKNVIVNIPSNKISRFVVVPSAEGKHLVIQLDDIMRLSLDIIFPGKQVTHFYSIKLSRDAELYLEDDFSEDVIDKIKNSLQKRVTGVPSRFLYDLKMPRSFLHYLRVVFALDSEDLIPGGKYHNFNDFFGFPAPDKPELLFEKFHALPHAGLMQYGSVFDAVSREDFILHFPYQSYDATIRFIEEAANDPGVESIKITLYRVASASRVAQALITAVKKGIKVTVFDEVQARFDEESNIYWGDELSKAGAKVMYSYEKLKVHSKLCLVARREGETLKRYAFLASGNFNEKTAKIYCDHGLLTADERLTVECDRVFDYLENREVVPKFDHLLVAPFHLRKRLKKLIDREIENAKAGKKARILLKVNSLEDKKMIRKLYQASNAGVKIRIIVRGICCLVPGEEGMSKNIKIISIVDRFLEHARVYIFHNGGDEKIFVSSADWMKRNLSRRVEVAFPIYDKAVRKEIKQLIKFQFEDNIRARKLNKTQSNPYKKVKRLKAVRAQYDTYFYLKEKHLPSE